MYLQSNLALGGATCRIFQNERVLRRLQSEGRGAKGQRQRWQGVQIGAILRHIELGNDGIDDSRGTGNQRGARINYRWTRRAVTAIARGRTTNGKVVHVDQPVRLGDNGGVRDITNVIAIVQATNVQNGRAGLRVVWGFQGGKIKGKHIAGQALLLHDDIENRRDSIRGNGNVRHTQ